MNSHFISRFSVTAIAVACGILIGIQSAAAQSVGLPLPRLLTTMPMGGTAGSQVTIKISGENIEDADQLYFSDARLTATRKLDASRHSRREHLRGPDCA